MCIIDFQWPAEYKCGTSDARSKMNYLSFWAHSWNCTLAIPSARDQLEYQQHNDGVPVTAPFTDYFEVSDSCISRDDQKWLDRALHSSVAAGYDCCALNTMPTREQMIRLSAAPTIRGRPAVYRLHFANLSSSGDFWNPAPWGGRSMAYRLSSSLPKPCPKNRAGTCMPVVHNWNAWDAHYAKLSPHARHPCFMGSSAAIRQEARSVVHRLDGAFCSVRLRRGDRVRQYPHPSCASASAVGSVCAAQRALHEGIRGVLVFTDERNRTFLEEVRDTLSTAHHFHPVVFESDIPELQPPHHDNYYRFELGARILEQATIGATIVIHPMRMRALAPLLNTTMPHCVREHAGSGMGPGIRIHHKAHAKAASTVKAVNRTRVRAGT